MLDKQTNNELTIAIFVFICQVISNIKQLRIFYNDPVILKESRQFSVGTTEGSHRIILPPEQDYFELFEYNAIYFKELFYW